MTNQNYSTTQTCDQICELFRNFSHINGEGTGERLAAVCAGVAHLKRLTKLVIGASLANGMSQEEAVSLAKINNETCDNLVSGALNDWPSDRASAGVQLMNMSLKLLEKLDEASIR